MIVLLASLLVPIAHAAVLAGDAVPVVVLGGELKTGASCMTGTRETVQIPPQISYELKVESKDEEWSEISAEMTVVDQVLSLEGPVRKKDTSCSGEFVSGMTMGAVYKMVWKVQKSAVGKISIMRLREEGNSKAIDFAKAVTSEIAKVKHELRGISIYMTGAMLSELFGVPLEQALATYRNRVLADPSLRQIVRIRTEKVP